MTQVTLAIVYHNEIKNLPRLLESLKDEVTALESFQVEVLFINNASTDKSLYLIEDFIKTNPQIISRSISRSINHMALARQQSLTEAKSPWVVYVDADSRLESGWLRGLKRSLEEAPSNTVVIGGASIYKKTAPWHDFVLPLASYFPLGKTQSHWVEVQHVPTNNYLLNKNKALNLGGFDPFFSYVGEDLDINVRLRREHKIIYNPSFRVEHYLPPSEYDWYLKMVYYGRAQSFVFLKYWRGISLLKIFPLLVCFALSALSLTYPFWTALIFLMGLIVPRSRFYMLSFIFYGLGEFMGGLIGLFYLLRGDLKLKNDVATIAILNNESLSVTGQDS